MAESVIPAGVTAGSSAWVLLPARGGGSWWRCALPSLLCGEHPAFNCVPKARANTRAHVGLRKSRCPFPHHARPWPANDSMQRQPGGQGARFRSMGDISLFAVSVNAVRETRLLISRRRLYGVSAAEEGPVTVVQRPRVTGRNSPLTSTADNPAAC